MTVDKAVIDRVLRRIDRDELVQLALTLGNIDSVWGKERDAGEFLWAWLEKHGFPAKKLGLLEDRFSVVGVYPGTGGGYSLIFNSHMDTSFSAEDKSLYVCPANPEGHLAWIDGNNIFGYGVVNDKGPMAAFMIAAKAIKESGVSLPGELLLTMVPGEIGVEAVDEFKSPQFVSKDIGARYMVSHGTVADYALVAEATAFGMAWVEAGKAFFKITVPGDHLYTPYIKRPTPPEKSNNAIVRMARVVERIDEWAYEYEQKHRYECPGGIVIPKVNIGAIRGGHPTRVSSTPEPCSIYLDIRIVPEQDPMPIKDELKGILRDLGIKGEVEQFLYRRGYEGKNVGRLATAVEDAHQHVFGNKPTLPDPPVSSMWRDINVFNEVGIPALTYGPSSPAGGGAGGPRSVTKDDLLSAAKVYAIVAMDICGQAKEKR